VLSCENLDEAENYLSEKWSEMAALNKDEDASDGFFSAMKHIVRQRVDFNKNEVEQMLKQLP
jgi:hypothetical protein